MVTESSASGENMDRVVVVLVRARNPGNIGAAARAMHDFGFRYLRVVNEFPVPFEAAKSAVDASAVMDAAANFNDVGAAIADCTLVIGTTAVGARVLQHTLHGLPEAAEEMQTHLAAQAGGGRIALLFGSEKTGLSNEELSHCHWLLTIPMQQHEDLRHPSMNLGQAVAVCLYELVRSRGAAPQSGVPRAATAEELERLAALFGEMLERTGYRRHHPAKSDEAAVRRLVLRMNPTADDVAVWMGILRQILWRLNSEEQAGRGK
jgi:TrmH family RNA methyltransferase